jgi:hypothetical protein
MSTQSVMDECGFSPSSMELRDFAALRYLDMVVVVVVIRGTTMESELVRYGVDGRWWMVDGLVDGVG